MTPAELAIGSVLICLFALSGFLRLPLNSVEGAPGYQDSPYCDSNQRPVRYKGRNEPFAPLRLLRLAVGTVLLFSGAWPSSRGIFSSHRSVFWRLLGKVLTVVLIGLGLICLFWDRLKDASDQDSENEPRLHNGISVPQKHLTSNNYWGTVIDMANLLNTDKKIAVIGALAEGSSIRSIERITGVHRDTIMRLGVKVGQGCAAVMDSKMRNLPCNRLEMDEIWGFVGKKDRNVRMGDAIRREKSDNLQRWRQGIV